MLTPRRAPRAGQLPAHMRRRPRPDVPTVQRPEPAWRIGHFDGPTEPAHQLTWARYLATGIIPPLYRNNPGACLTLVLKAQALDIPIATAAENLHWNAAVGKGALSAQLMAALLRRHGYQFTVTEETDQRVAMTFHKLVDGRRRRLGDVDWRITEAIGAGLMWRDQWRHYPTDMLWARCLMRGARRYASEVGTGLAYTVEELADMSGPADGSELADAVQDILNQATTAGVTADQIRGDLVKQAKAKKLLGVDVGDGQTLGYVLAMLWGQARAREVDEATSATPTEPAADTAPAGTGQLPCGCPADQVLRTGQHDPARHAGAPA